MEVTKPIRKLIDLPPTVVEKLEILAEADRRKIKPYMEKVLIEHCCIDRKSKKA